MSKFTPGPWKATRSSSGIVYITDSRKRTIAQAWDFPEAEANGRIIAVAPEMLIALKDFVDVTEGDGAVKRFAQAVIAKAEGGAS